MKKNLALLLVILLALLLCACTSGADTPPGESIDNSASGTVSEEDRATEPTSLKDKTVGLAMHFLMDDYAKFFVQSFEKVMNENGVAYDVTDGQADPVKQLDDVTNFYNKEVDAMVIVPFDENAVRDKCNEMAAAGIPVVAVTYMPDTDVVATVPGGDYENGYLAGQLLIDKLNSEGKVVIFDTPIVAFRMTERIRGLRAAISDAGANITIQDIKTSVTPESFMQITIDMLNADPNLDGIFGNFGNPVIGAASAIKELNKDDVVIVGIDADYSVMHLIKEGWVQGVAAQFPSEHGRLAAEFVIATLRGEEIDDNVEIPHQIVTPDNVSEMAMTLWEKEL